MAGGEGDVGEREGVLERKCASESTRYKGRRELLKVGRFRERRRGGEVQVKDSRLREGRGGEGKGCMRQ